MILGNLVKEPEKRADGKMTKLVVATTRTWSTQNGEKKSEPEFHTVVCWGKVGEIVDNSRLQKNHRLTIQGYLKTRSSVNESGHKVYQTEIIAEKVIFID